MNNVEHIEELLQGRLLQLQVPPTNELDKLIKESKRIEIEVIIGFINNLKRLDLK